MLYKTIVAATLCAIGASEVSKLSTDCPVMLKRLFDDFKHEHRKSYSTMEEETHRFNIFVEQLKVIDERNAREAASGGSAVHGITRFSDMTQEEFEETFLDKNIPHKFKQLNATIVNMPAYDGKYGSVDYTGKQTTAIKDQGHCGSCWAHAAAEQIESDGMRLFGNPASLSLSVQQLVDCDHGEGQLGCNGGLQETAFDYVRENGGIVTEADYPYTSYYGKDGRCDRTKTNYVMGVNGYEMILADDVKATEEGFTTYVLSTGTVSIGVDATTWNTYTGGVMADCGKGTDINHAVQLVGVDNGENGWWKIRNSWSADWGEEGNIRITYGSNTCGLATEGGSYTSVFNI
mmetsp:Transcript_25421/g.37481  ORF Transcript_25421/g.37481 Transcript_25421/m.37481 type:complete len:347 (+) Transcript_25421:65-1105(+)|eukprot:CAMPEP_0185024126 /NCGR_PEP_ID=MMETSP1103-20130426/7064_1 /TAXON_ID=36769 /ORGANISM="Paraphysomonas bandaiensis, Strain Caron Lab Isolate" /LENGTH=346 /DNA_ID=CAMNT_0027557005 /DNA_START=63 /DNA_END=1103 /DNA_ORIENTATION=-